MSPNRIDACLLEKRKAGKKALVVFTTAGFPSLDYTEQLILELEHGGADMVELGLPFSDPIADGPVIEETSHRSLSQGTKIADVLALVRRVRQKSAIPLLLMSYYNPILAFGESAFASQAQAAGIDGLIIVDLPPEEADSLTASAGEHELATVFLVTPVSSPERVRTIARASTGFIYSVSYTGVTGGQEGGLDKGVQLLVENIRQQTRTPILVGFGIRSADDVARVTDFADGAIVGSAILREILATADSGQEESIRRVRELTRRLKAGAP